MTEYVNDSKYMKKYFGNIIVSTATFFFEKFHTKGESSEITPEPEPININTMSSFQSLKIK